MLLVQLSKRAKLDLEFQLAFCENRVLNLYFNPPSELLGKHKCVPIVGARKISARKIWSLLELLAKIMRVLTCSCSQNFCKRSHAPFRVAYKHNLHLENKNRHWKPCFPYEKLGNIVETYARHGCFWKNASSSFC